MPFVLAEGNMSIEDVEVKVDGDKESGIGIDGGDINNVKPDQKIEIDVKIENKLDIDIEYIEIVGTLYDMDDGDDIEFEVDSFDLRDGRKETSTLEFQVPLLVEKDTYDLVIEIEGEDENNTMYERRINFTVEIDKDTHNMVIHKAELDPESVDCQGSSTFKVRVINLGEEDEDDTVITMSNSDLNFNEKVTMDLEEGGPDDDVEFIKSYTIDVPEEVYTGSYPIRVKVDYDDEKKTREVSVNLNVVCAEPEPEPEPETETEEQEETEEVTQEPEEEEQEETSATTPAPATTYRPATTPEKKGFNNTTLMIVLAEIIIIIVGVAIVVSLLRKK